MVKGKDVLIAVLGFVLRLSAIFATIEVLAFLLLQLLEGRREGGGREGGGRGEGGSEEGREGRRERRRVGGQRGTVFAKEYLTINEFHSSPEIFTHLKFLPEPCLPVYVLVLLL